MWAKQFVEEEGATVQQVIAEEEMELKVLMSLVDLQLAEEGKLQEGLEEEEEEEEGTTATAVDWQQKKVTKQQEKYLEVVSLLPLAKWHNIG